MIGTPEEIFNPANDLKWFYLKLYNIDNPDDYIDIQNEMIINIETKFERNNPIVKGVLTIKDLNDLGYLVDWESTAIEVYFQDYFDEFYLRRFIILNIEDIYMGKTKNIKINFQDEFSWVFQNTYISKGFNESKSSAFQKYFDYLELPDKITESGLTSEFQDDGVQERFVVPKNINLLDFFLFELHKVGHELYQTRKGIFIKSNTDLLPGSLEEIQEVFTDETPNQMYQNKIFDCVIIYNNKQKVNLSPKNETNYYDFNQKRNLSFINNDLIQETSLNDTQIDLQETNGLKAKFQNRLDDLEFNKDIKDNYLESSEVEILTNGYNKRDINQIIDVNFSGNIGSVQGITEGNKLVSGKYLVKYVVDKIVGGKLIQKLGLIRSDKQNSKI